MLVALLINHGYSSAFPFGSNGIISDQANYMAAKSSQIERDMQVPRQEAKDDMSVG